MSQISMDFGASANKLDVHGHDLIRPPPGLAEPDCAGFNSYYSKPHTSCRSEQALLNFVLDKLNQAPMEMIAKEFIRLTAENDYFKAQLGLTRNCIIPQRLLGHKSSDILGGTMTSVPTRPPGTFEFNHATMELPLKPLDSFGHVESSQIVASTMLAKATAGGEDDKHDEEAASHVKDSTFQTGEKEGEQASARAKEKAIRPGARDLRVEKAGDGSLKCHWPVDAKKLNGKDSHVLSPSFDIFPGSSFKMMLRPNAENFKRAKGCGSVELKLIDGTPDIALLNFRISVGEHSSPELVAHDFSKNNIAGSSSSAKHFDFKSAVDTASSTLLVTLEVITDPSQL